MLARAVVLGFLLVTFAAPLAAVQTPVDTGQAARSAAVRVFLDCPTSYCDFDFFRTEITFVTYVRDRQDAQVHILLTTQNTGAGGTEFTLAFIGLRDFAGVVDTLRYASPPAATDDEVRREIVKRLRLGLIRYAARTPVASQIEISYDVPAPTAAQVHDPWNYWVFRARLNGNFDGEKSYRSRNLNGNVQADRVTEDWKILLRTNGSYRQSDYDLPVYDTAGVQTGTVLETSITRRYEATALIVRSLSGHWSAGFRASALTYTYVNQDLNLRLAPAVEFNVFPYKESTRRQLTFQYQLGVAAVNYTDTTIYGKTRETLFDQTLTLNLNVIQPWGSAGVGIEGRHYLHNFARNHLEVYSYGDFRIYRGLSLNLGGGFSIVHDQLFLAAGGATPTEVLTRLRQLETNYSYYSYFGLSYTFGSIYNNIVNPRF